MFNQFLIKMDFEIHISLSKIENCFHLIIIYKKKKKKSFETKSHRQKFCKQIPLFYTFRSVYGREPGLRTYSIDVPDDRHPDGDRRDIQVILIERTTIS